IAMAAESGSTIAEEPDLLEGRAGVSSTERIAEMPSMARAAEYLDRRSLAWTRERKCGSCHTNYPYLMARPALKEHAAPAMSEVRHFFEERVAHWDDNAKGSRPKWDAEVVATAAALAINDAATSGKLHPLTRKALDRIWTLQKPNGGFDWLKCDWPPYEHDDYYGAIVAALGVGQAPEQYVRSSTAAAGLTKLRSYFSHHAPPELHHATMLLWASTRLDGVMSTELRDETIARLREIQRPDGGWNLASLGRWKRRDGTANDPGGPGDGYGTGLVVFVLRQAGIPASDPSLKRGVAWLLSHQRESGGWFTRSVNNDRFHYIANAGTAFAVLALRSCNVNMVPGTAKASSEPNQTQRPVADSTSDKPRSKEPR
ncbi:MAG: prenyltransferase/squalene oxidase repeat-containing protein, partial [Isosphaeraceae bacterium]